MNQLEIRGRIYPDHKPILLVKTTKLKCGDEAREFIGFTGDVEVVFSGQNVKVIFTIAEGNFEKTNEILNFARYNIRAILDIWCFLESIFYDFQLETIHWNGQSQEISFEGNEKLKIFTKKFVFDDVFEISFKTPELRRALDSLRLSQKYPDNLAFFTFQAVEAIRHYFKNQYNLDKPKSWEKMNEALNTSKDWTKEMCELALEQRHGGHEDILGIHQDKFAKQAWEVTQRFIELLKRNVKQLPTLEFPILD